MRRDIMALGVLIILFALVFQVASYLAIEVEPPHDTWANVNEGNEANPPLSTLFAEANLTAGEKFRVFFALQQSSEYLPDGVGLALNVSEPYSDKLISYTVHATIDEMGKVLIEEPVPYPPIIANYTGTYRADGRSFGVFLIRLLVFQKFLHIEAKLDYPLWYLSPTSIAVFLGGVAVLLWGIRSPRSRRSRRDRKPR